MKRLNNLSEVNTVRLSHYTVYMNTISLDSVLKHNMESELNEISRYAISDNLFLVLNDNNNIGHSMVLKLLYS